jgi:hypothetical protein
LSNYFTKTDISNNYVSNTVLSAFNYATTAFVQTATTPYVFTGNGGSLPTLNNYFNYVFLTGSSTTQINTPAVNTFRGMKLEVHNTGGGAAKFNFNGGSNVTMSSTQKISYTWTGTVFNMLVSTA